ncbi:MAG: ubiquinol-cytochrome c reductase iron-sulfur subunit [Thermodesulfovibrionales bacterium]|nr:ubiquinol-cytochrome c reductase iron-sulfur subunit [Thermodesulfovibrionales bacterium]
MSPKDITRRRFMEIGIGVMGGFIGATSVFPIIGFITAPSLKQEEEKWIDIGAINDFPPGTYIRGIMESQIKDGWYITKERALCWIKVDGDKIIAVSAACTHLGCNVYWDEASKNFKCPCHAGVYDSEGKVIKGPPPRALDRLQVKVEGERVFVNSIPVPYREGKNV